MGQKFGCPSKHIVLERTLYAANASAKETENDGYERVYRNLHRPAVYGSGYGRQGRPPPLACARRPDMPFALGVYLFDFKCK